MTQNNRAFTKKKGKKMMKELHPDMHKKLASFSCHNFTTDKIIIRYNKADKIPIILTNDSHEKMTLIMRCSLQLFS